MGIASQAVITIVDRVPSGWRVGRFGIIAIRQEGFWRVNILFDGFVIASECETHLQFDGCKTAMAAVFTDSDGGATGVNAGPSRCLE
jgi:hypothetical protein